MCVCVYVCVCVCVCVCVRACECVCACVHVCVCMSVHVCAYVCGCAFASLRVCMYVWYFLCVVKTEAPVEALGPMSGMAELSSRIQSNVMAEHMDGGCFDDISATGLSAAQIASVSQSDKIQRFSKEIILKLPSGSGGSFYSSRHVERMLEGVTHTHASCLEIAFTEWSRNEQVPNRVELLQQLIEDDNNWELDMEDARYELERILSCRQT